MDEQEKASSEDNPFGEVNWNHRLIPPASRELQNGWKTLVRSHPAAYLKSVLNSLYLFFTVEIYRFWDNRSEWLPHRTDAASAVLLKSARAFAVPAVFLTLYVLSLLSFARLVGRPDRRERMFGLFCLGTLLYVLGLSVTCELGEASIMRVPIDPLLLLGALAAVDDRLH